MGGLSLALYRLIVPARQAENATNICVDKISATAKISLILANYSSLYICSQASCKKLVKTKSDHHHCPISVYTLTTSKIEAFIEIHRWGLCTLQRVRTLGGRGGGRKGRGRACVTSLITLGCEEVGEDYEQTWTTFAPATLSPHLSVALSLDCLRDPLSIKHWVEMTRTMQNTVKSLYGNQALRRTQIYEVTKRVKAGIIAADYRHQNQK